jgi:AraC-like DNA-binding protein
MGIANTAPMLLLWRGVQGAVSGVFPAAVALVSAMTPERRVGRSLALLHREPSRRWTIDMLARDAGASRTTIAERFTHYLGEPPMTYLARWRLQLGARLLATTQQSVLEIAGRVGYESEASFNRAFRRQYGLPPGRYRRDAGAVTSAPATNSSIAR